jgi:SAM-dependent methyltransferase
MPGEYYDVLKYERSFDKKGRYGKILRKVLRELVNKSGRIADFGCGTGYFPYKLSRNYVSKQFYGYDINRSAILKGRARYRRKNLRLSYGKLKGTFDLIFTIKVLHEIKGKTIIGQLRDFTKHLDANGFLYVCDYRKVSKKAFREELIKEKWEGDFNEHYKEHNKYTKRDWEHIFKRTGFRTVLLRDAGPTHFIYVGKKV